LIMSQGLQQAKFSRASGSQAKPLGTASIGFRAILLGMEQNGKSR
jgi:hypothetical protein